MRSLTPILEEGVFCLRYGPFGSIGADVTEEAFSLTGHGGLKPVAPLMPCSMPASLSPTPVSRRNSGPVGPRQHQQANNANVVTAGGLVINGDDCDDYRPSSAHRLAAQSGHRRLDRCLSEPTSPGNRANAQNANSPSNKNVVGNSSRYKTELCRAFEETGHCKYGEKCQFAHGHQELRTVHRHRKYKTELCRTYHTIGFCPYGPRCHFIHNADEARAKPTPVARPLSMSISSSLSSSSNSPTHSDSLSGSPTSSYGLFWMPGDEDRLNMESPPSFLNNNNNVVGFNKNIPDMDIFTAAAKPPATLDFPDFLSAPAVGVNVTLAAAAANLAVPRLPVFSRLAGAKNNADPADR